MTLASGIAALRALVASATPGPWRWNEFELHNDTDSIIWPHNSSGDAATDGWAALLGALGKNSEPNAKVNANLIVALVNAAPAILAAVEAAQAAAWHHQTEVRPNFERSFIDTDALDALRTALANLETTLASKS